MIFLSAGFDAHKDDPLSITLTLTLSRTLAVTLTLTLTLPPTLALSLPLTLALTLPRRELGELRRPAVLRQAGRLRVGALRPSLRPYLHLHASMQHPCTLSAPLSAPSLHSSLHPLSCCTHVLRGSDVLLYSSEASVHMSA